MALGTLEDNVAKAFGHGEATCVEGTGTLIAGEIVVADTYHNKAIGSTYQVLIAIAVVNARIEGRIGVNLTTGIANGNFATAFLATTGEDEKAG